MLSYRERVDDSLLGPLPDLSLTEAADGAKFINAGGEELFWRYGAFSQPYGFVRWICCRARKTVRSPASTSADTVHSRKATLRGSIRSADQKVSSPITMLFRMAGGAQWNGVA